MVIALAYLLTVMGDGLIGQKKNILLCQTILFVSKRKIRWWPNENRCISESHREPLSWSWQLAQIEDDPIPIPEDTLVGA